MELYYNIRTGERKMSYIIMLALIALALTLSLVIVLATGAILNTSNHVENINPLGKNNEPSFSNNLNSISASPVFNNYLGSYDNYSSQHVPEKN
jgi:hypothetical protein